MSNCSRTLEGCISVNTPPIDSGPVPNEASESQLSARPGPAEIRCDAAAGQHGRSPGATWSLERERNSYLETPAQVKAGGCWKSAAAISKRSKHSFLGFWLPKDLCPKKFSNFFHTLRIVVAPNKIHHPTANDAESSNPLSVCL